MSYVNRPPRGQQRDKIYREALRLELADCALASARLFTGDPKKAQVLHQEAIGVYRQLGEAGS